MSPVALSSAAITPSRSRSRSRSPNGVKRTILARPSAPSGWRTTRSRASAWFTNSSMPGLLIRARVAIVVSRVPAMSRFWNRAICDPEIISRPLRRTMRSLSRRKALVAADRIRPTSAIIRPSIAKPRWKAGPCSRDRHSRAIPARPAIAAPSSRGRRQSYTSIAWTRSRYWAAVGAKGLVRLNGLAAMSKASRSIAPER